MWPPWDHPIPPRPWARPLAGLKATVTIPNPDPQDIIRAAARVKSVIWEHQIEPPESSLETSLEQEGPDSFDAVGWGLAKSLLRACVWASALWTTRWKRC